MNRGRKREPASIKAQRGTAPALAEHPSSEVETDLPRMPPDFPAHAVEVWNDLVVLVEANRLATERDSQAFANLCQLQAMTTAQFTAAFEGNGAQPSIAALAELRKQLEVFGLQGVKSRIGAEPAKRNKNPFASNGVK
ncbi:MAG: hypothetical protein P1U65_07640 [Minwuia sp.]|nr:hypothetical protein [Minwuia sp.]